MITSNKNRLIKEGYLDVKVPAGNRERRLWKAWQRRWLVSKSVEEPCGLQLQIYGCQKTSNGQPLWTVFISPESGKLYRSRSRTHAWAFSIAHEAAVLLHLAGESEQLSQTWMACIRDALWPPSPLVQLEAAFQDVHRVSLIDDDNTCRSDLFGAYGHLYMAGEVVLLMSTHSGRLIREWRLDGVLKAELERLDEGTQSGVFSLTTQKESSRECTMLHFYSPTATSIVENLSSALKLKRESRTLHSSQSALKYDSGIQELSELLSLESKEADNEKKCDSQSWSSDGLRNLAAMSGDFLNCSINSVFSTLAYSVGSRSSSEASSDYSPPTSPTDPTSPNQDSDKKTRRNSNVLLDNYYYDTHTKYSSNSLEDLDLNYALMASHRTSTSSDIYADISSLPPSKRPSIAETLYEDIDEEDEDRFIKLMDEIMEDEYMPPLPPPRNAHTTDRPANRAKRPSTLDLENLSSSISETLSQLQAPISPEANCKTDKRSFPVGLLKPIQGVKKILGNKKSLKSQPIVENSRNNIILEQKFTTETLDHPSEPLLIMNVTDCSNYSDIKPSPTSSNEQFVPFPELMTSAASCEDQSHVDHSEETQVHQNIPPTVVRRGGNSGKQTRSCDSLLVESLKSKYSCHREFLKFLQIDKHENSNAPDAACEPNCIPRSVSLEQLPCKSYYCLRHSSSNAGELPHNQNTNSRKEDSCRRISSEELVPKNECLESAALKQLLSRRKSSDYCVMDSVVSCDSTKEAELYLDMHSQNGETEIRKDASSQEWSSSLQMQITEQESLYMDMTLTTK